MWGHEHSSWVRGASIPEREWRKGGRKRDHPHMKRDLPQLLRRFRTGIGRSQLQVATAAGTTQRHLSFLESGRARPGRDLLSRVATALELTMSQRNQLFEAAGFLPGVPTGPLTEAAYAPIRQAAWRLIEKQAPYPAMLLDKNYNVLASNPSLDRLLSLIAPLDDLWHRVSGGQPERNLLRLTFHQEGLIRYMREPALWLPGQWHRIVQDAGCHALINEIANWPHMQEWVQSTEISRVEPALLERYVLDGQPIDLLSMIVSPGAPSDITAASLRVNLLFPADDATDRWLCALEADSATAQLEPEPGGHGALPPIRLAH